MARATPEKPSNPFKKSPTNAGKAFIETLKSNTNMFNDTNSMNNSFSSLEKKPSQIFENNGDVFGAN